MVLCASVELHRYFAIETATLGAAGEQNEHGESKMDRQAEVKLSIVKKKKREAKKIYPGFNICAMEEINCWMCMSRRWFPNECHRKMNLHACPMHTQLYDCVAVAEFR